MLVSNNFICYQFYRGTIKITNAVCKKIITQNIWKSSQF